MTLKKYFFQRKRIWHSFFDFRLFIFLFKIEYYPITRKEQNEKLFFFCIFFKNSKHIFLVLTKVKFSSPNDVMKFIDTKRKTFFFHFFLTEKSRHVYLLYYQPAQEMLEQICLFTVLNSRNFAKGMALPKASFLSSLHAWFRLHIG